MHNWNIMKSNYNILKDYKLNSYKNIKIINQLRSQHISLNGYHHILLHYDYYKKQIEENGKITKLLNCLLNCCITNHSGKCNECNIMETVNHFLLICNKYNNLRSQCFWKIERIMDNYGLEFNLKNILFPSGMMS